MRKDIIGRNKKEKMHLWYPLVMLGLGLTQQMVAQWVVFYYAPPTEAMTLYLNVGQISIAMVIGRIIDGIADPFLAYYSDRATFKHGRRRPFMAFGFPFLLLSFLFVWRPPVEGLSFINFIWATFMLSLFFFSYSAIVVPYLAILPELARDDAERVRLATAQSAYYGAGVGLGFATSTVLSPLIGFPHLSLLAVPLVAFAVLTPLWSIKEDSQLETAPAPNWIVVLQSLKTDSLFLLWILSQAMVWSAFTVIVMLIPYVGTVILDLSSVDAVFIPAAVVFLLISGLGTALAFRILKQRGKDAAYHGALFLAGLLLMIFPLQALQLVSAQLFAALIFSLAAGPLVLLFVLPNAVVAELAEHRRKLKEERWEALLYAAQGIIVKLAMAGGSAMFGGLLYFLGSTAENPSGIYFSFVISGALLMSSAAVFQRFLKLKIKIMK